MKEGTRMVMWCLGIVTMVIAATRWNTALALLGFAFVATSFLNE